MRGVPVVGGFNSFIQHERKERSKPWNRRALHAGFVSSELSIVSTVEPSGTVTTSVILLLALVSL